MASPSTPCLARGLRVTPRIGLGGGVGSSPRFEFDSTTTRMVQVLPQIKQNHRYESVQPYWDRTSVGVAFGVPLARAGWGDTRSWRNTGLPDFHYIRKKPLRTRSISASSPNVALLGVVPFLFIGYVDLDHGLGRFSGLWCLGAWDTSGCRSPGQCVGAGLYF